MSFICIVIEFNLIIYTSLWARILRDSSIFWVKITLYRDEVKKKKKKRICGVSFVEWRSFKINKTVILFYRELVSRSRNLNQRKSRSLLGVEKHFNVEVGIYYFVNLLF